MIRLFVLLLFVASAFCADFQKTNFRAQVYAGVTPYYPIDMNPAGPYHPIDNQVVVPLQGGFLWSPFFNPLIKLDVPFTIWLGAEIGNWQWADLSSLIKEDTIAVDNHHSSLSWSQFTPAVTGAISFNVVGNLDLRFLGGIGWTRSTYSYEQVTGHPETATHTDMGYFGTVAMEYVVNQDIWSGTDLKIGAFVRQDAKDIYNLNSVLYKDVPDESRPLNGLIMSRVEQTRTKFGIEVSLDFGRESRKDRKTRFKLRDRDAELRKHNKGMDTITEWDCMAIERDYKFYLLENGKLPDMHEQFTLSQFTDVMESFLSFCAPEDLKTKESLYASLDSSKVHLKTYQMSQEEARYKQVMASNDPNYLKMFLQYYPNSRYRSATEAKIQILDDYAAFRTARTANSYKDYLQYLTNFPDGHYRKEAETGIFALVQSANRQKDYEIYLKKFPNGIFVNEARRAQHEFLKQSGAANLEN